MKQLRWPGICAGVFVVGVLGGWMTQVGFGTGRTSSRGSGAVERPAESSVGGGALPPAQSSNKNSGPFAARLEEVLRVPNPAKRAYALGVLVDGLSIAEIREAVAELQKLHSSNRDDICQQLFARWAELDPGAALEAARGLHRESTQLMKTVLEIWAGADPIAAEKGLAKLPVGFSRQVAQSGFVKGLAESDPQAALAFLRRTSALNDRWSAESLFTVWSERDPAGAAAHLQELPVNDSFGWISGVVAKAWAETDREGALAWAMSPEIQQAIASSAARSGSQGGGPVAQIFKSWLEQDPEASMQWLREQPADDGKNQLLRSLAISADGKGLRQAAEFAAMMLPGSAQNNALATVAGRWAFQDFSSALDWARQQTDPQVRQAILGDIADARGNSHPQEALSLAGELEGKARDDATGRILYSWAGKDPSAAAAWAAAAGNNAKDLRYVAAGWVKKDLEGAGEWMDSLPDGDGKDQVVDQAVWEIYRTQPKAAADWVGRISDEAKRNATYKEVLGNWLKDQSTAAAAWIAASSIPQNLKDALLANPAK